MEIRTLRKSIEREFGFAAIAAARLLGPVLWATSIREDRRLARGQRYEPATVLGRRNWGKAYSLGEEFESLAVGQPEPGENPV